MKKSLIAFAMFLSSALYCCGCAGMQVPVLTEAQEVKEELDGVADQLESTMRTVAPVYGVAKMVSQGMCGLFVAEATCKRLQEIQAATDEAVKVAEDAIKHYRKFGDNFDEAHAAVKNAADKIWAFKLLVDEVRKSEV